MMAASRMLAVSAQPVVKLGRSATSDNSIHVNPSVSCSNGSVFAGVYLGGDILLRNSGKVVRIGEHRLRPRAATAVATPTTTTTEASPVEEVKEYSLPSWAQFELGKAPVYWKTMNGLPPTAGEKLKIFYNPAASSMTPNEEFGVAFNGGFNQPIMCGGEPRAMLEKTRGKADPPFYTIQICIPKHAMNLIFSFTNGSEWDGPYRLQFQVPKAWRNKPITFFNEGLAEELSKDGACEKAIFPDTSVVVTRCAMIGNLTVEGGDRCNLDIVVGCTDPGSHLYNPLASVDDGSCPIDSDFED